MCIESKQQLRIIAIAGIVGMISASVQAGDVLKFKSATFDPKQVVSDFSTTPDDNQKEFIVQFKNHIRESDKKALSDSGVQILRYIPEDALIVNGDARKTMALSSLAQVRAVIPYNSNFKINTSVTTFSVFDTTRPQDYLISTFSKNDLKKVVHSLKKISGLQVLDMSGNSIAVRMNVAEVPSVAKIEGVENVQDFYALELMDFRETDLEVPHIMDQPPVGDYTDLTGFEDGTHILNTQAAYSQSVTGQGQRVGLADTGVDLGKIDGGHPDLNGGIYSGYAFGKFSKTWNDPMGHGTHCAGSILSRGTSSGGKIHGSAIQSQLVAEGMWSQMMNNMIVPGKLADLFGTAYKDGARVHSNSWGAPTNLGAYDNFSAQVDDFMFQNPDMLIIYAAGNSGQDIDKDGRIDSGSVSSPGTAKNALTVGASKNYVLKGGIQAKIGDFKAAKDKWSAEPIASSHLSETPNGLAMFSSRGPTQDGRLKPDVVAPGTNILSLRSQVQGAEVLWGAYNDLYTYSGGTSMSTPLVAGTAALVRQYLQTRYQLTNPSAALVKATLMHTADDLFPGQFGEVGAAHGQEILTHRPNNDEGYGRVDIANVMQMNQNTVVVDNKVGVATGEKTEFEFTMKDAGIVMATMVYTDAPASTSAHQALVNDLDMTLLSQNGQEFGPHDSVNNHEYILTNVAAGTYKLVVTGVNVPMGTNGKQPYAVVFSTRSASGAATISKTRSARR